MSDLRAPDPTLDARTAREVLVVNLKDRPPTAHRKDSQGRPQCLSLPPPDRWFIQAEHAAYIAVPCRQAGCFPDAPLPGRVPDGGGYGTPVAFLAWQVP